MSILVGTNSVSGIFVGTQSVSKIYVGTDLVFSAGGGGVPLTLHGAPGEYVNISGANSSTIQLDSYGDAVASLVAGTTQFSCSISGYVTEVNVQSGMSALNLYPVGAMYWYGRYVRSMTASSGQIANSSNSVTWTVHEGSSKCYTFASDEKIAVDSFTKLKFSILYSTRETYASWLDDTPPTYTNRSQLTRGALIPATNRPETEEVDITSVTGNYYIGIGTYRYSGSGNYDRTLQALWLE